MNVAAEDPNGNVDTSFTGDVTIQLGNDPNGNSTLGGTLTVAAVDGVAHFSNLTINEAAQGFTLLATSDGQDSATTDTFNVSDQLVVIAQPPTGVLSAAAFDVKVSAEDANGNVDTNYTGNITIQLSNDPNKNTTLRGTLTVAAVDGVADFNDLTINEAGEGFTLLATSDGQNSATTSAFDISDQLVVTTQPPTSVLSGAAFDVKVSAEDANGNVDTNFTGNIAIQLGNDPNKNTTLRGTLTVAAVDGVANFSNLTINEAGKSFTLLTTSDEQDSTTTKPFEVSDPLFVNIQPPTSVLAGGKFDVQIAAEDIYGYVDTNFTSHVTMQLGSDPNGNSTLGGTLTVAAVDGVANFSNLTINKAGQGFTLQATSDGQDFVTSSPFGVTTPFSPAKSMVTVSPGSVQFGNTTTITLQDKNASGTNETIGGLTVAFRLGSTSGGQGTIGPVTDNGNGTYTATFTGTIAGSNTIKATINGSAVTSTAPSIKVAPGPVSLENSLITLPSGNIASGSKSKITLQAEDANGNKETTGGLEVAFTLGSTSGGMGTFSAITDNHNGTYTVTFTGTIAGNNTIIVTIGGAPVTSSTPAIAVTPGAASLAKSLVTVSTGSILSGTTTTVTLQAKDAAGNDKTSGGLKVAFKLGSMSGGQGMFSSVTDNHNGTYTATFTGTIAGSNTIDATIGGFKVTSIAPSITVTPGPVSLAKSVVTVSSTTMKSGSAVTITLQAKDTAGNKETSGGLTVLFTLLNPSGGQGTFSSVTDNGNGTYTATFTGTIAGSNTITATVGGSLVTSAKPSIKVTPGPVDLANSLVTLSVQSIELGGTTKVTLQAKDAAGNNETSGGLTVLFLLENTDGGLGTFSLVTDNHNGTYTATFKGTVAGSNAIAAKINGQNVTSTAPSITIA